MRHAHRKDHCGHGSPPAGKRLLLTLAVTTSVAGVIAAGGLAAGSLALVADAAHMLLDSLALVGSLVALGAARRPPSARHPWGFGGAETLAALGNGLLLLATAWFIAQQAWLRMGSQVTIDDRAMLAAAAFGLAANCLCLTLLHGHQHSLAMRGAFLHVLGDAANSVGVVVSALLLRWTNDCRYDCYASWLIAAVVAGTSLPLFAAALALLLQASPNPAGDTKVRAAIGQLAGVTALQSFRPWRLSGQHTAVVAQVVVAQAADVARVRDSVRQLIDGLYPGSDQTVEVFANV